MPRILVLTLVAASLAGCRSRQAQIPAETAPEVAIIPMYEPHRSALAEQLRATVPSTRSVGTLNVQFGGKNLSAKLDLRVQSAPETLIWMDVADPIIGLKIGRARVYQDSVQGYIKLYRQYVNEPLSRLRQMGIDLRTEDARRLALGLPLVVPKSWTEAQWSVADSAVVMSVVEPRGTYNVHVEVATSAAQPGRVLWQRLTSQGQQVTVTYAADGSWVAEVPSQGARAEFRVAERTKSDDLTFPFELPSNYARTTF
ncbi:MAG: hypothetical protein ACO31C_04340 [Schleiferiaceae bacterium]